jgi:hypothetical protein
MGSFSDNSVKPFSCQVRSGAQCSIGVGPRNQVFTLVLVSDKERPRA